MTIVPDETTDIIAEGLESIILASLCALSFSQILSFALYDCVAKISKPYSTVHFTKLTAIVCAVIFSILLISLGDMAALAFGPAPNAVGYLYTLGFSLTQALFLYFLVIAVNPLLTTTFVQKAIQWMAIGVAAASGLQLLTLILLATGAPAVINVASEIQLVTIVAVIVVIVLYGYLLVRRQLKPLRNPRGNEHELIKWGLASCANFLMALVLELIGRNVPETLEFIRIFSRLFLNISTMAMIKMKFVYNKGLMRTVGGKVVFSRGYSITETDELEMLQSLEKPTSGIGSTA